MLGLLQEDLTKPRGEINYKQENLNSESESENPDDSPNYRYYIFLLTRILWYEKRNEINNSTSTINNKSSNSQNIDLQLLISANKRESPFKITTEEGKIYLYLDNIISRRRS